ncbi:Glycerophosphocholine phosphodiesterase [Phlyctochytrium bullatum]|nr:Glycerophosphocholine phosphodiesterase [Phlyctochytrium bullatum]
MLHMDSEDTVLVDSHDVKYATLQPTHSLSLHDAARANDVGLVRQFLADGADFTAVEDNLLPIELASSKEVWEAFAERMPAPKMTLLEAAEAGDAVAVCLHIAKGADITQYSDDDAGMTALHLAAKNGHLRVVAALLSGQNEDGRDRTAVLEQTSRPKIKVLVQGKLRTMSFAPLHWAAMSNHDDMVKLLLLAGADMQATTKDFYVETAAHVAARFGSADALRILMQHGADVVNTKNSQGYLPLHLAALFGHASACEALFEEELVYVDAKDHHGRTPWYLAVKRQHNGVAALLQSFGSIVPTSKECQCRKCPHEYPARKI